MQIPLPRSFASSPTSASSLSRPSLGFPSLPSKPHPTIQPTLSHPHGPGMPICRPSPPRSSSSSADRTSPMSGSTTYTSTISPVRPGSCGGRIPGTVARTGAWPSVQRGASARPWTNSRPAAVPAALPPKATRSWAPSAHALRQSDPRAPTSYALEVPPRLTRPPTAPRPPKSLCICRTRVNLPMNFQTISIYTQTTMCVASYSSAALSSSH